MPVPPSSAPERPSAPAPAGIGGLSSSRDRCRPWISFHGHGGDRASPFREGHRTMKLIELPETKIACKNLVGGEWKDPESGERIDVISPYTGTAIGTVPMSNAKDVDNVVAAAKKAAANWRHVPIKERTQTLFNFRQLVLARIDDLANS